MSSEDRKGKGKRVFKDDSFSQMESEVKQSESVSFYTQKRVFNISKIQEWNLESLSWWSLKTTIIPEVASVWRILLEEADIEQGLLC